MRNILKTGSCNNDVYENVVYCQYTCDPSCALTYTTNWDARFRADHASWRGYNTPRFHHRVKTGALLPMTPYKNFSCEGSRYGSYYVQDQSSSTYHKALADPWVYSTDHTLTEDDLMAFVPQPYDSFVADAAAKIYSSGHDTLTFLAELASVKKMFISTGRRLLSLDFPRNWRRLNNDYLEYRYGWRPLLSDMKQLNEAVQRLNNGKRRYKKSAGTSFDKSEASVTDEPVSGLWTQHHSLDDQVTVSVRGSVVADIDIPEFSFNPIITAWEIIPYSFVIDWFLNVGTSLSALSFLALRPQYVASAGVCIDVSRTYQLSSTPGTYYRAEITEELRCKARLLIRTPAKVSIIPRLTLKISFNHLIDLMALILQKV